MRHLGHDGRLRQLPKAVALVADAALLDLYYLLK